MRWTDGSGAAYGEEPYGAAGYAHAYGQEYAHAYGQEYAHAYGQEYAHGQEYAYGQEYVYGPQYRGGVATDTTSSAWDGGQPAQWTYPAGQTTTAWDYSYGDVLTQQRPVCDTPEHPGFDTEQLPVFDTAQLPVLDTPGHHAPAPDTPTSESARPVFVDSSGRRQRRVLRAARLLVIPAGGYVAVLISTMLGGPSAGSPFVPHSDATHSSRPRATAPDPSSDTGHPARSTSPTVAQKNSGTAVRKAPRPTDRATASTAPASPSEPTTTAAPTPTAAPTHSSQGRGLGSSHKPVK